MAKGDRPLKYEIWNATREHSLNGTKYTNLMDAKKAIRIHGGHDDRFFIIKRDRRLFMAFRLKNAKQWSWVDYR